MVVSMIVHDSCIHSNRWNRLESGPIHYHIGQYSKSYFTKHLKHFISKVRPKGNFSSSNSTSFLDCPHVPEIVWYVLLTELQSLVKNSNFGKFYWAAFWKSDIFAEILILSNPQFKPKLKPRLKGFCLLTCVSPDVWIWNCFIETDGVYNGTKNRTYETLENFRQVKNRNDIKIKFHYVEFRKLKPRVKLKAVIFLLWIGKVQVVTYWFLVEFDAKLPVGLQNTVEFWIFLRLKV